MVYKGPIQPRLHSPMQDHSREYNSGLVCANYILVGHNCKYVAWYKCAPTLVTLINQTGWRPSHIYWQRPMTICHYIRPSSSLLWREAFVTCHSGWDPDMISVHLNAAHRYCTDSIIRGLLSSTSGWASFCQIKAGGWKGLVVPLIHTLT